MTMFFDDARTVERPAFFDGQQLYAADLQGLAGFHRAMRWLHNSSLHQPGVGSGFAVAGRRGDREVRVDPGYALDADGREIVLLEAQVEPVPPVAVDTDGGPVAYDISVSYPADDELEEAETREGVCLPRGAVRLRERPVLCWIRLARDVAGELRPVDARHALDLQRARKIAIARAFVRNCKLDADLSIAERRNARPEPCPHIARGHEAPVAWEAWEVQRLDSNGNPEQVPVGLQADVDTRAAAFRLVPTYTARPEGPRPIGAPRLEQRDAQFLDVPAFVTAATRDGFHCFVPLIGIDDVLADVSIDDVVQAARQAWGVVWMGVEP
jgi:hypothetical protein